MYLNNLTQITLFFLFWTILCTLIFAIDFRYNCHGNLTITNKLMVFCSPIYLLFYRNSDPLKHIYDSIFLKYLRK